MHPLGLGRKLAIENRIVRSAQTVVYCPRRRARVVVPGLELGVVQRPAACRLGGGEKPFLRRHLH